MTRFFDYVVVGGGVAGLGIAGRLASRGYSVVVLEEDSSVGKPKHCTGLVSSKTLSNLGRPALESVLGRFDYYLIRSTSGSEVILRFGDPVYLLERVRLEELMKAEAEAAGARVLLKQRVVLVRSSGRGFVIRTNAGTFTCGRVVICEGAKRTLVRALGIIGKISNLLGIQAVVYCSSIPQSVIVYVGPEISRRFFGWCVPFSEKKVLVGLADEISAGGAEVRLRLNRLIRLISRELRCRGITEVFGGLMPIDKPMYPAVAGNMLVVGDAASMVKPLTGGGLYVISMINKELGNVDLDGDLGTLNKRVHRLFKALRMQYWVAKVARSLGYYRLLSMASAFGSRFFVKDYDAPHRALLTLTKGS